MSKKIIIILFLFLSLKTYCDEINGKLTLKDTKIETLVPGDIFSGVLRLWPEASGYYNDINSLKGKVFIEKFFVSDVEKIQLSPNNKDVLEAYLKLVLLKNFPENHIGNLKLNKLSIPVSIQGISTQPSQLKPKNYLIMEQDGDLIPKGPLFLFIGIVLGLLFLVFIIKIAVHFSNKNKLKKEFKSKRDSWIDKIKNSNTMDDYTDLYKQRSKWSLILSIKEDKIKKFEEVVNRYQYKKNISESEMEELDATISEIREGF